MAGTDEGRSAGSLSIGALVRWHQREREVAEWQGPLVTLVPQDGAEAPRAVSFRWLVGAEDFAVLSSGAAPAAGGAALEGRGQLEGQEEAELWQAHMVEIDTGLAPGRSEHARGFGPDTTLAQRCAAMSARLAADGIRCSAHALADNRRKWKAAGENPVVLLPAGREKRPGGFTDPRCLSATQEVVARRAHASDVTIDVIREEVEDLLHSRYAKELGSAGVAALLPSRSTFYLRMKESGLADALGQPTRSRAALASTPADPGPRRRWPAHRDGADLAHRCGQPHRVCVDDHAQPPPGRRERAGGPGNPGDRPDPDAGPGLRALAGDARLGPAQCGRRLQSAVRGAAGCGRAVHRGHRRPPGHPPRADHLRPGQPLCERALHRGLRPAAHRPPPGAQEDADRQAAPFFFTLAHRFSQHVTHGWQGRSHKKRGRGIGWMPLYTIAELQQMAQEWVALKYQQTPDAGLRDPFQPSFVLAPNEMYAVQVARSGYRAVPLSPPRTASSCCRAGSSPARAAS
ncbi:hypothetical protein ACFVVB_19695 [Streptomyces californicus]|uniref:hypothetical protein n=1 Tax=Streptomyces californicus TaxID=67351 RepID=UPI0036DBE227